MAVTLLVLKDAGEQFTRHRARFNQLKKGIVPLSKKIPSLAFYVKSPDSRSRFTLLGRDFYIEHTVEYDGKGGSALSMLACYEVVPEGRGADRPIASLKMNVGGMVGELGKKLDGTKSSLNIDRDCEEIFFRLMGEIV